MFENIDWIADVGFLLSFNKSRSYQSQVKAIVKNLINFLQENSLVNLQILGADEPVAVDLKIFKSNLTDDGLELVKTAYHKWLKAVDHGRVDVTDVTILKKALEKIRKK